MLISLGELLSNILSDIESIPSVVRNSTPTSVAYRDGEVFDRLQTSHWAPPL
jgi:hypothetical protein